MHFKNDGNSSTFMVKILGVFLLLCFLQYGSFKWRKHGFRGFFNAKYDIMKYLLVWRMIVNSMIKPVTPSTDGESGELISWSSSWCLGVVARRLSAMRFSPMWSRYTVRQIMFQIDAFPYSWTPAAISLWQESLLFTSLWITNMRQRPMPSGSIVFISFVLLLCCAVFAICHLPYTPKHPESVVLLFWIRHE